MLSQTALETTGSRKIADKVALALMVCIVLAGPFWPRITLSTECLAVASALITTSKIWSVSRLVTIGGYLAFAAGLVLAAIHPIH
jgi:hypothetical protein